MLNELWAFFCIVGFWGWVVCAIGFIIKSFPKRNTFSRRPATMWGGALLAFYILWVLGMVNA